jgi:hypothetical protein
MVAEGADIGERHAGLAGEGKVMSDKRWDEISQYADGMPGPDYFARLGVDAEVDPEALPIEQRFIDDGVAEFERLLRDHS